MTRISLQLLVFTFVFACLHICVHNDRQGGGKCLESANVVRRRAAPPVAVPPTPGLVTAAKVANVSSLRDPQVAPLPNAAAQKCNSFGVLGIISQNSANSTNWVTKHQNISLDLWVRVGTVEGGGHVSRKTIIV